MWSTGDTRWNTGAPVPRFSPLDQLRRIDAVFLIFALSNLLRAAEFAQRKMQSAELRQAIKVFKSRIPGLTQARGALEHFDDWRAGVGTGQRRRPDGTWIYIATTYRDPSRAVISVRLDDNRLFKFDATVCGREANLLAKVVRKEIRRYVKWARTAP